MLNSRPRQGPKHRWSRVRRSRTSRPGTSAGGLKGRDDQRLWLPRGSSPDHLATAADTFPPRLCLILYQDKTRRNLGRYCPPGDKCRVIYFLARPPASSSVGIAKMPGECSSWPHSGWLMTCAGVPKCKIVATLYVHQIYAGKGVEDYWQRVTGLPSRQFRRPVVKTTPHAIRKNPSYVGCCRLVVCSSEIFWKLKGWQEGLLSYLNTRVPRAPIVIT